MAFSFSGILASVAILATGITTNVVVFSTYQAGGGKALVDFDNIPDSFKEAGGYQGDDPELKQQYLNYRQWGTSVLWYLYTANCPEENKLDDKKKQQCKEHRDKYPNAPEVKSKSKDINILRSYYESFTKKKQDP
ncbi:hypothetical protein MHLP_04380 [Candidatus Mycoplasma haematolamae str. Purdue]|uniref:Uncharacterized protein n=1 Tax=Mycoplasma haematolamae (strain Purdue) TaxID=1212765 RepID=I7CH20_MYCHA|nr:hypothetical protein [Candidatus Mycoplasma haematolamae]AFO52456.1 hypothetical protein MHLP_04380 [Candidatus Mycoplasma haematolamae str. Purdue]